jgi:hypothetical protein
MNSFSFKDLKVLGDESRSRNRCVDTLKKIIDKHNFDGIKFDNYIHRLTSIINQKQRESVDNPLDNPLDNQVVAMQTYIDLDEVFRLVEDGKDTTSAFEQMWCGWYDNESRGKLCEDWFITSLNDFLVQDKIVFVFLDLYNYFLVDKETENPLDKETHDTVNHSTAMIFFPDQDKINVFYFNSHGDYQLTNNTYSRYMTKTRFKVVSVPDKVTHVDGYLVSSFVDMFNRCIPEYTDTYYELSYDLTYKHNYYGTNLQCIDDDGFCYIYPFLVWYELTTSLYNTNRFLGATAKSAQPTVIEKLKKSHIDRRFNSYAFYLSKKEFTHTILLMMCKHFPIIKEMYFQHTKIQFSNPLLPKRMKSREILHKYSQVYEYQQTFYENMEQAFRISGPGQFMKVINNLVDFAIQPEFLAEI